MSTKVVLAVSPNATIEVEGESSCDIFEGLSDGQEVFGNSVCGVCNCEAVKFLVRTNTDEDKFYEMVCKDFKCRAKLAFGCIKKPKGGLYPKVRWDALSPSEKVNRAYQEAECRSGYLPNGGWFIFKSNKDDVKTETKEGTKTPKDKTAKAPF